MEYVICSCLKVSGESQKVCASIVYRSPPFASYLGSVVRRTIKERITAVEQVTLERTRLELVITDATEQEKVIKSAMNVLQTSFAKKEPLVQLPYLKSLFACTLTVSEQNKQPHYTYTFAHNVLSCIPQQPEQALLRTELNSLESGTVTCLAINGTAETSSIDMTGPVDHDWKGHVLKSIQEHVRRAFCSL